MNPHRHIRVSIDTQRLTLVNQGRAMREYVISTAARGMGFTEGSFRTPTGNFRIIEKIGHDASADTIFKARVPAGKWQPGKDETQDLILARILRLDGLDPENQNTRDRFIYIHGTNDTRHLGRPASMGCIRMSPADIIDLFPMVTEGMDVVIETQTKPKGKLFFIDCDSTLSSIEGIDELARARGPEIFAQVAEMTRAAMHGEIPLDSIFEKRLELIRPDRELCEQVAQLYIERRVPGADRIAADLRRAGWTPVILSGGFKQIIEPLAKTLGIEHVEAVPLVFDADGKYAGYDTSHPASHNMGKCRIIKEWQSATLPTATVMMGDGASDLETRECTDAFICFTGVVDRPGVSAAADITLDNMQLIPEMPARIEQIMNDKINIDLLSHNYQSGADMSSKTATKVTTKTAAKTAAKAAAVKTAAAPAAKKSAVKGKRYTPAEKKEILTFIEEYNTKNGRGGQSHAAQKFNVSQITLANWLKSDGKPKTKKSSKKAAAKKTAAPKTAAAPAPAPAPAAKAVATTGSLQVKLSRLLELDQAIATTEASLATMKNEFTTLKNSL